MGCRKTSGEGQRTATLYPLVLHQVVTMQMYIWCGVWRVIYIVKILTVSQLSKALLTSGAEQKMRMNFSVQLRSQVWSSILGDKSCISSVCLLKQQSSTQSALHAHMHRESQFTHILFRNIWSEQRAGNWISHINRCEHLIFVKIWVPHRAYTWFCNWSSPKLGYILWLAKYFLRELTKIQKIFMTFIFKIWCALTFSGLKNKSLNLSREASADLKVYDFFPSLGF